MATTENLHDLTEEVNTRPTQTLISAQRMTPHSITNVALTERVMNGSRPFLWTKTSTQTGDFGRLEEDLPSFLPIDAVVTRTSQSNRYFDTFCEGPDYVLRIESSLLSVDIEVAATSHARAREVGTQIAAHFPTMTSNPNEVSVLTWRSKRSGDIENSTKIVAVPAWSEISENYATHTGTQLEDLMHLGPDNKRRLRGRVILWHGTPGTGKTSAIRALMREWSGWCEPELLVDPEAVFAHPQYLLEVMAQPARKRCELEVPTWRLLIAEDADRYLQPTTHLRDNLALDRLLNVADGILGQGCNIIILLTTNSNVASLHPALTRPGRCLAITEFEKFDNASARRWINGRGPSPSGPVSLAELYEIVGDEKRLGAFEDGRHGQYL